MKCNLSKVVESKKRWKDYFQEMFIFNDLRNEAQIKVAMGTLEINYRSTQCRIVEQAIKAIAKFQKMGENTACTGQINADLLNAELGAYWTSTILTNILKINLIVFKI